MQKLRRLAIGASLIGFFVTPSQLKAATYTFTPVVVINNTAPILSATYTEKTFPSVSLSIQNSVIQSGYFSASYIDKGGQYSVDDSSLTSFTIGDFVSLPSSYGSVDIFRANLLFDAGGSVSAGAISFSSEQFQIDLAGTAALFQGAFSSPNNMSTGFVTGTFTAVPEPTSLFLLGGSIISAGLLRRRSC